MTYGDGAHYGGPSRKEVESQQEAQCDKEETLVAPECSAWAKAGLLWRNLKMVGESLEKEPRLWNRREPRRAVYTH